MIAHEAFVAERIAGVPHAGVIAQATGAALVVIVAWLWDRRLEARANSD